MTLQGKGFYIWKIPSCENGSATSIANAAATAKLTHVLVKIADGTSKYNISSAGADLVPGVISALKAKGIQTWGWQYVYGSAPASEARIGGSRAKALGLDGFVVDAEIQFEKSGMSSAAATYMVELRKYIPTMPVALSTFRYPSYHSTFPFSTFLKYCDISMPQVYWEAAHNSADQLLKSYTEYMKLAPTKPYFPTGPTYKVGSWAPTTQDLKLFMNMAVTKGLPGVNFFSWDECRRDMSTNWNFIRDYQWTIQLEFQDQFIAALNSHNTDTISGLYNSSAIQILPSRTIQGLTAIKSWYSNLFTTILPSAAFTLTGSTTNGNTRHINWTATSTKGKVTDGMDTFGVTNNKIDYHYSYFTVS
jgi:hypothetical protein